MTASLLHVSVSVVTGRQFAPNSSLEAHMTRFEEMMEPNFIMLKTLLADGLKEPFADRAALFR